MTFDSLAVTTRGCGVLLEVPCSQWISAHPSRAAAGRRSVTEFSISRQFTRTLASSEPAAPQPGSENNRKSFSEADFGWTPDSSCLPGCAVWG